MTLIDPQEASRFGFDWPSVVHPCLQFDEGAHVQVVRTTSINRGKRGVWRVLTVKTERDELDIYVTPTGKTRVFRKGKGELKIAT